MRDRNKEKGSITLYVLLSMMFFLVIVITVYSSMNNKIQQQEQSFSRIKSQYEKDELYVDMLYEKTVRKVNYHD